jgi:hypothetical protein
MWRQCSTLVLLIVFALLTVRCAPTEEALAQSSGQKGEEGEVMEPTEGTTSIVNPEAEQTPEAPAPSAQATEPPSSEPGQVPGKAASVESAEGPEAVPLERETVDPALWPIYKDDVLHFSVSYPPDYVIKRLDDAELAELTPMPLAAVYFYNRQTTQGDVAEIAPPEFAIRVFENGGGRSVESWLAATGLASRKAGWLMEAYKGKHVAGVKASSPNFMAPGWSVYVAEGTRIFQLTPLGLEAEAMLETFRLVR